MLDELLKMMVNQQEIMWSSNFDYEIYKKKKFVKLLVC